MTLQSETLRDCILESRQTSASLCFRRDTAPAMTFGAKPLLSTEARDAIAGGYKTAWAFFFDRPGRPMVSVMARHHRRAVRWHWVTRHRICRSQIWEQEQRKGFVNSKSSSESDFENQIHDFLIKHKPRYRAYFPIWSRGHMKSAIARRIAVMDALISIYYGLPAYCLYFSGTDEKTNKHSKSIERILQSSRIREHAPLLAEVQTTREGGRQLGWKATLFYTAANCVFHFGSLQSGLAGGNLDDVRPTLLIPDDIDDRKNSVVQADKNFELLTTEILGMGDLATITFFAENLINRYSCMYRIYKRHVRVLTDRMPAKPTPAVIGLKTELRTIDGELRDIIVAGVPTWPRYFDLPQCQDTINRMGLPAFLRECQHEVEQNSELQMLYAYDDQVHTISESEFASVYGNVRAYKTWNKWLINDWARTKTKYHANVAAFVTTSSQNTKLPGFTFIIHPMSFKPNSAPEDVMERAISCLAPHAPANNGDEPKTWQQLRKETLLRVKQPDHLSEVRERLEWERKVLSEIVPKYSKQVWSSWNVQGGVMSHSEDTVRKIYREVFGITLSPSNPQRFDAIDDMNRAFRVDYAETHPFRPAQFGYSRAFIIVPDWKDAPTETHRVDPRSGKIIYPPEPFPDVLSPDELHDDQLIRYQLTNWRRAEPKMVDSGEKVDDVVKTDDDFGQALQMLFHKKLLSNVPLSKPELVEEHMPQNLTIAALDQADDETTKAAILAGRLRKIDEITHEMDHPAGMTGTSRFRRH